MTTAPLLERDQELETLRDLMGQVQQGHGRVAILEAPAGFGKTSLLKAAAADASKDRLLHLAARATELERDFAYGIVRQLLEPLIAKREGADRQRLFAGAADLAEPLFVRTAESDPSPWIDRSFAMLHGLYWLLNNLTDEGPVVLSVDDLQWADSASVRFLNFLMPRLDGLALAVLAATRPEESTRADIASLAAGSETVVLRPGPLSAEATAALCERRLGSPVAISFAAACRDATGGNPFLLAALLREIGERGIVPDARGAQRVRSVGPTAVARAVTVRLSDKPPAATALVRAVAILGDGSQVAEAAHVAGLPLDDAERAAGLLVALDVLQLGEGLEFVHPIVREAVYGDMSPVERVDAHARAATLLSERGAADERIAAQLLAAAPVGDPSRVTLLRRVADQAMRRGAPADAATMLSRALAEPPPPAILGELLIELSSAKLRLGMPEAAIEPLRAAIEQVEGPALRTWACRLLGGALTWAGKADEAVAAMTAAIIEVEPLDRELTLLLEADRAAFSQQASLEVRATVAGGLERFADVEGTTPAERLILASLAFERAHSSSTERDAVAHIGHVLADGRLVDEQAPDVTGTLYLLVVGLLATDALDVADALLARMLAEARARASIPAQAFVLMHRGWVSIRRGDLGQAEEDARAALELLAASDVDLGGDHARALLIESLVEQGDLEEADEILTEHGYGVMLRDGMANNAMLEARSMLRLAQGRTQEGLDDLNRFGRVDELSGGGNPLGTRWRSAASLAIAVLGNDVAARELAAEDLNRARRWGAPSGIGIALHATALVERDRDPTDRLRQAVAALETSPARLEHARALVELGAALRRANHRADARRSLERGLQMARRCGARLLAEAARTELRAAGGRSSEREGSGIDTLTTSERRVAELAAEGQSNPEIAQALFVTRKTVETHLGHVYQKLAISGRGKLARALPARGFPIAGSKSAAPEVGEGGSGRRLTRR